MENEIIFDDIHISPLLRAQEKFETFRQNLNTDQDKAGAIQAFEFCYELAWKILKRVLNKKGVDVASPRDTFRTAAQNHLLNNLEAWFDFQVKRNLTAHAYNEVTMEEVIVSLPLFSVELQQLIDRLKRGDEN
ncbi:MAG: HI0074 family nucleotidyltransferase substrate-binding subunit [Gammaproteobacteria bacterium]|nr:HI0074 family nucleotidyltransferase substrate-binding subunit [Gammaproteobacteria bacterium]